MGFLSFGPVAAADDRCLSAIAWATGNGQAFPTGISKIDLTHVTLDKK